VAVTGYQKEELQVSTYKIVRFCLNENDPEHRRVIERGLTLEEAQEHCSGEDTHGDGWFDGYYAEEKDGD
jgi:hypothetical protein